MCKGITYQNPDDTPSNGGITPDEFMNVITGGSSDSDHYGLDYAPPSYDAVWAAALALNMTQTQMTHIGE